VRIRIAVLCCQMLEASSWGPDSKLMSVSVNKRVKVSAEILMPFASPTECRAFRFRSRGVRPRTPFSFS